ncbi:SDR family NAD(P)-dependent oxidoreductase [Candidatus Poribacteria bacterium]|nr:SDR family NAD(P)-dependent oxidoreductase [Candidatus Poribacteria bacterium]
MKLEGKKAIIAGGSGGIGHNITRCFLENGATVIACGRSFKTLIDTQTQLSHIAPSLYTYSMDVSEIQHVDAFFNWYQNAFDSLDILINCAGIQMPIGKTWEVDPRDWLYNLQVNLFGTFNMASKAIPIMLDFGKGKIINFSGGGATSPRPNFSAYASSKAGVVRFTETLAHELKGKNIDVNAIAPGAVNTRMLSEVIQAGREQVGKREYEDALKRQQEGGAPPDLAAELALFLASDESDGITGRLISAIWDNWHSLTEKINAIQESPLYTLRRIDNKYFHESRRFQEMKSD